MTIIRNETLADAPARERLLDIAFGDCRYSKTSERLREGRLPSEGLSFVACREGRVIGSVRLWDIAAGAHPALLLGPLVVACDQQRRGIGAALIRHALKQARRLGHGATLLVGDAPYYGRFGFSAQKTADLRLPGPYERHRLLALELRRDALTGVRGLISATGRLQPGRDVAAPLPVHLTGSVGTATPLAA